MKVFRSIVGTLLILIIIGGVGFLVWNITNPSGNMLGMNMGNNEDKAGSQNGNQQQNTDNLKPATNSAENNNSLSTMAIKNKDRLGQVITTISDAINLITIDPYSKITVPKSVKPQSGPEQQGNTTINIYPNTSNAVNVPNAGVASPSVSSTGTISKGVFDQAKLEQLHNGIFKLAQGMMLINNLNDDLTLQATVVEPNNYDTYVKRYNILLQNKLKLTQSLKLINEASVLVNVNPYTLAVGYEYDVAQMEQLHKGIYKLAQGLLLGVNLGEDFSQQMAVVSNLANSSTMNDMSNMKVSSGFNIGSLNATTILYVIIVVFVMSFVIALFGAVRSAFKPAR